MLSAYFATLALSYPNIAASLFSMSSWTFLVTG
jgi:hypothetical protein